MKKDGKFVVLATLGAILALQAVCTSVTSTLWPLFISDVFQWTTREYSIVLVASSCLCTVGVAAVPKLER